MVLAVLSFLITEVLGNGKTGEGDTSTSSWGLIHLTEHQGDFGLAVEIDDLGFLHFVVQIVTLAGTLTHTSKYRVTTMSFRNVVLCPSLACMITPQIPAFEIKAYD